MMPVRRQWTSLLAACLCAAGCGDTSPGSKTSDGKPNPPRSEEAAADPQIAALLGELTQMVRNYAATTRSVPKSLDDLVAAKLLPKAPTPPAGKRFVISDKLEVYVANQP
jgi:hypothetical protein